MADEKEVEEIVVPWWPDHPIDDEWDSPGYNEFWGPVEQAVQYRIDEARRQGKEIKLVAPSDTKRNESRLVAPSDAGDEQYEERTCDVEGGIMRRVSRYIRRIFR